MGPDADDLEQNGVLIAIKVGACAMRHGGESGAWTALDPDTAPLTVHTCRSGRTRRTRRRGAGGAGGSGRSHIGPGGSS